MREELHGESSVMVEDRQANWTANRILERAEAARRDFGFVSLAVALSDGMNPVGLPLLGQVRHLLEASS